MEQKYHGSPLSKICYQDSTFMLENMLPFVPTSLKLPLAVMIKWSEMQRILKVFQDTSLLRQYGLFETEFSMEKFAGRLSECPNKKLAESISQMGQMMQMMQVMQMMNAMNDMPDSDAMPETFHEDSVNHSASADAFSSDENLSDEEQHMVNEIIENLFPPDKTHEIIENNPIPGTTKAINEPFDIEQFIQEVFS